MSTVKTAISLQESLFNEAEKLARRMKISRSHLFALALEEFINRRENETLLEQINQAVDTASSEEDDLPDANTVRRHMRRMAQDEW